MSSFNLNSYNPADINAVDVQREQAAFMTRVYMWMSVALSITGGMAYYVAGTPEILNIIFSSTIVLIVLVVLQIGLVMYLTRSMNALRATTATALFLLYAALNGLLFSSIFIIYTESSIASTFLITAGTFAIMSAYGYFTKSDLTRIGNLCMMALIGLILASVVNIFWNNETLYWICTYVGVLIFVALVAYDTQKVKQLNVIGNEGTEADKKESIMGALILYLDFINLFLYLLRIFGKRK
ncbi:MAG: hypothetical protein RIR05_1079 [Bacteroidota bacterium]|jgi:FtsH-binding integral membrane protein